MTTPRHFGQKFSLACAIFSATAVLPTSGYAVWVALHTGTQDVLFPAALATAFFFACVAGVCYVMSRPVPPLPPAEDTALSATE